MISIIIEKSKTGSFLGIPEFNNLIKDLPPGKYEITISNELSGRSDQQNKYYWKYLIKVVMSGLNDTGIEKHLLDESNVHEMLKGRFLRGKSTAELTKKEFSEFIEAVQRWASEYLNIYLKSPNEQ